MRSILSALTLALVGCGGGDKIYDVSGTVTHGGKAVPKGLIFFDPAKGTPGSQGFANIEDGAYDTAVKGKGKGIRGGSYEVRILAFDGKAGPDAPFGKSLFPEVRIDREFPPENQKFDHDVKK